jgi:predicted ABC-type ATPase
MTDIVVLGGPNGAGKTTAAQVLLPSGLGVRAFVNADDIARDLSPFNVSGVALAAGRLMLERMRQLVRRGESFAFETTCSGLAHSEFLRRCRERGWRITLLYLWLPSPEAAIERVARRVAQGGHDIPPMLWCGDMGKGSPTCSACIFRWPTSRPSMTIATLRIF